MGTLSSEYLPRTTEGRILALLLGLYGLAASGYLTAALAAYFLGHDAETREYQANEVKCLEGMRAEIAALHADVRSLKRTSGSDQGGPRGGPERSAGRG
jgi:voltage-gated potassium channel